MEFDHHKALIQYHADDDPATIKDMRDIPKLYTK